MMQTSRTLLSAKALLALIALAKFSAHMLTASNYGYFRDEFYYVAASKRLDIGYVDFPLFIAWVTALIRATFGESLLALHFVPAAVGTLTVLMFAQMARVLGGGSWAQVLAALAALVMPVYLTGHSLLTMDTFDQFWWVLAAFVALRTLARNDPRGWLSFGLVAGIGLLTKVTIGYLGAALAAGLVLTGARRHLASRQLWLGGGLAALFLAPYLLWQLQHDFATLDFWRSYAAGKTNPVTPLEFLVQQILIVHPLVFVLALTGLAALFFWQPLKPFRAFGWIYVIPFAVLAAQQAKNYFLAGAYPVCIAAGAIALERFAAGTQRGWLKPLSAALLLIGGTAFAPVSLPVLPPEAYGPYRDLLGADAGVRTERDPTGSLPVHFADRFGWTELADAVGAAAQRLGPEDRARACIYTDNYGEAGALELLGAGRLPPVISGHNSYHLWGTGACDGSVVILVNKSVAGEQASFAKVEIAGALQCRYCMPYENGANILIGRGLRVPIAEAWPGTRHFD